MPIPCLHLDDLPHEMASRSRMPSLRKIAEFWDSFSETKDLLGFPVFYYLSIGATFCFACMRKPKYGLWCDWPTGCMERAHLQDASLGGLAVPINLIPLCHRCHKMMTRDFSGCWMCALAWVRYVQDLEDLGRQPALVFRDGDLWEPGVMAP